MGNSPEKAATISSSQNLALVPFILDSIGNPKLTKKVSWAIGAGMILKWGWDIYKGRKKESKYTTITLNENQKFYDYVIKWVAITKPEYEGSEFEFVDLGNIRNNKENREVELKIEAECLAVGKPVPKPKTNSFDFIPAGRSKIFVDGIEVLVEHERFQASKDNKYGRDKVKLSIASKKEEELEKIFEKIEEVGRDKTIEPKSVIYTFNWGWRATRKYFKVRDVVLPNNEFQKLKQDIQFFLENQEWYEETQVPWRRGYLLEGLHGAGKGTTVQAIATHFNLDVYVINLSEMTDDRFRDAVSGIPEKAILLLEDIDCAILEGRKTEENTGLSFSGLLNVLDGICVPEGRVTFMTTNHKDKLDPALIRPGRVDYEIHFTYANFDQIIDLARKFKYNDKEAENCAKNWSKEQIGMSEVQNRLLKGIK